MYMWQICLIQGLSAHVTQCWWIVGAFFFPIGITVTIQSYSNTIHRYIRLHLFFLPIPLHLLLYYYDLILSTCVLYDIYLRATTMTTISIRGVQIPICLYSSTTDSIKVNVAVLKLYQ